MLFLVNLFFAMHPKFYKPKSFLDVTFVPNCTKKLILPGMHTITLHDIVQIQLVQYKGAKLVYFLEKQIWQD
jgi:hypothetical protein